MDRKLRVRWSLSQLPAQSVARLSGPVLPGPALSAADDGPSVRPCVLLMAGLRPHMMFLSGCPVLPVASQQAGHHRGRQMRPHQCTQRCNQWQGRRWPRAQPSRRQRHQSPACMTEGQACPYGQPPSQSVACLYGLVLSWPAPSAAGDGPSGRPCVLLMAGLGPYMMFLSGCPVLPVAGHQTEHHRGRQARPHQCTQRCKLWQGRRWPRAQPSRCQLHQSLACMTEGQCPYGRPATVPLCCRVVRTWVDAVVRSRLPVSAAHCGEGVKAGVGGARKFPCCPLHAYACAY